MILRSKLTIFFLMAFCLHDKYIVYASSFLSSASEFFCFRIQISFVGRILSCSNFSLVRISILLLNLEDKYHRQKNHITNNKEARRFVTESFLSHTLFFLPMGSTALKPFTYYPQTKDSFFSHFKTPQKNNKTSLTKPASNAYNLSFLLHISLSFPSSYSQGRLLLSYHLHQQTEIHHLWFSLSSSYFFLCSTKVGSSQIKSESFFYCTN